MLYLFDLDGTLIRSFMRESGKNADYDFVELLPRRREVIRALADLAVLSDRDLAFGLVTNQGGVAFGYQTRARVYEKVGRVIAAFDAFHGFPLVIQVCLDHPRASVAEYRVDPCHRRKPGPGMILDAMASLRCTTSDTVFVGDMATDEEAAIAAGVDYFDAENFFIRGGAAERSDWPPWWSAVELDNIRRVLEGIS